MVENLSVAVEDYLKAIYTLGQSGEPVTTNRLANWLGVAAGSVTGMMQKLATSEPPLVIYHKHHGVELTPEGEKAALEVIRHHRLLELFLQRKLGYSWDEVHAEADRLEHIISEEMEERIAQALGNPDTDPHGEPIPNRELELPKREEVPLSDMRAGQKAKITRVDASDIEFLKYLSQIGLVPQALVSVEEYSPFDSNLRLKVNGNQNSIVLGLGITQHVYVGGIKAEAQP